MKVLQSVLPLIIGFLLDFLLGDPYAMPHPVRMIGNLIEKSEIYLRKKVPEKEKTAGIILTIFVLIICTAVPLLILIIFYHVNKYLGIVIESIFCYYLIAPKCLMQESGKVEHALRKNDVEAARKAVSMIVGRDTEVLDEKGIIKAAVETVAENTSDGVTAPLMYMALGGAAAGFFYKAANTMDSMIGYKNEKYLYFGRAAAKLDDFLNYIPSRITALMMILSAFLLKLDWKNAYRIWKRDRRNHASPNSAQTESVCAGALDIILAGDAYYFGKLYNKKTIGDDIKPIEFEDIRKANCLMYMTSVLTLIFSVIFRAIIIGALLK